MFVPGPNAAQASKRHSDGVNAMIMKHAGIFARTLVAAAAVALGASMAANAGEGHGGSAEESY